MSSYIDTPPLYRTWGCIHEGHSWKAHTFDRLAFVYGAARAQRIMGGNDADTQADVARWNALGRRAAA